MIFRYTVENLTTPARSQRIHCLEAHIRQASNGRYKIQDYLEWLEVAGLAIPSRQTLHDDVAFYASLCDDIDYGHGDKWLRINPDVDRDAVRWFLGAGWGALAVRPRLSSSTARCLLMAYEEHREVELLYAKLEQLGQGIAQAETWRVIPHHVTPGLDSAYMSMWLHSGRLATFNLARIIGRVAQTGQSADRYAPVQDEAPQPYQIHCVDPGILTQLRTQYRGLDALDPHQLGTTADPATQHFLEEMLQGWAWRTSSRRGNAAAPLTWTKSDFEEEPS